MRSIREDLRPHGRIALDTNVCIYFFQPSSQWFQLASDVMTLSMESELYIPDIVRLELLAGAYRTSDASETARLRRFIEESTRIGMDDDVVDAAAQLRATTRMRTPDALVAASAAVAGCGAIVGNDARFRDMESVQGVTLVTGRRRAQMPRYVHLGDYLSGA